MNIRAPLLTILAAGLAVSAMAQPKVTLKFATLAPEGSAWMQAFDKARQDVLEATGGEVALKVFPAGVLGEEKDVLFKIKVGQVDGGAFIGFGIGRICPDARALMFPLIFNTYEEVDAVFAALLPHLEKQCLGNGYVALGWTEVGFSYLFSTKPVRTLDDLRGAKPWLTPGEEMLSELFAAGRVNGIPVTVADVLTALQTGLIQTIYSPPLAAVAMQWHTRVRCRNDLRLVYSFGGVFLAERAWKSIPEAHQEPIRDIFRRRTRELTEQVRRSDVEALRVLAGQGIETLTSPPAALQEFQSVAREGMKKVEGRLFSREAADQVRRRLEDFRAGAEAHAP
ncbi:MAG: TRAP transporter substrate-binding protein DctP [Kiritimatiellae bacterium]|nr:TRAP transporter substrate-binding protein DctP [Kiritimatiellia bacterium]